MSGNAVAVTVSEANALDGLFTPRQLSRMTFLAAYASFVAGVKLVLLWMAVVAALICVVDWLVRIRRISPFSWVARFFRARIDPLVAPIERMVLRAGGRPSSAAWWAFLALVIIGILVISLLQLVGGLLTQVVMVSYDPRRVPALLIGWAFSILRLALIVRVIASWLPVSPRAWWLRWSFVLTEWMLAPLRRLIPRIGMIDITPLVAWFALSLIQGALGF